MASSDIVYSAVYSARQTYLVTVNFNTNSVEYKKALALLQYDYMRLTRIQLGGSTGWFYQVPTVGTYINTNESPATTKSVTTSIYD